MAAVDGISISELGWLVGIAGAAFGIVNVSRSCRKDNDAAAREMATILTSLEYLKKSMDSISGQMTANQASMVEIIARLGGVEKSVARAHTRIDRLAEGAAGSAVAGWAVGVAGGAAGAGGPEGVGGSGEECD